MSVLDSLYSLLGRGGSAPTSTSTSSHSSSSYSSTSSRSQSRVGEITPQQAERVTTTYLEQAQKFQVLASKPETSLDRLFRSYRELQEKFAKAADSLRSRAEPLQTVWGAHNVATQLIAQIFYQNYVQSYQAFELAIGRSAERSVVLKCFLDLEKLASKALTVDSEQTRWIRQRHTEAINYIMENYILPAASKKIDVKGLVNASGNCSINSLTQMLFSAKPFLNTLLHVPELTELRKAYLQYCGLVQGVISSQEMRRELHTLNHLISPSASSWQDAHEILTTMFNKVPQASATQNYPIVKEVREFEKEALAQEDFFDDPNQRTVLRMGQACAYTTNLTNPSPFVFLDPKASGNRKEALFEERLFAEFDADTTGNAPAAYLHQGDPDHLYTHKHIRMTKCYPMTPNYLILVNNRYQRGERANDTAMQMPRVLQLPENAVEDQTVDRRLILKSFVVSQPGHYVAYVRQENRWFYCSDSTVREVSIDKVDQALYYTRGGGSLLHYYERPTSPTTIAQVPQMSAAPIIDDRIPTSQTQIAFELKSQLSKKSVDSKVCTDLFMKLDPKLQSHCYELTLRKRIENEGIRRFAQNPKALLPFLASLGTSAAELKALLEKDPLDLKALAPSLRKLSVVERLRCFQFLCQDLIAKEGIGAFCADMIGALNKRVWGSLVIDQLIGATMVEPPKTIVKTKKMSQIEVADLLMTATSRNDKALIKKCVEQLDEKYRLDATDPRTLYLRIRDELPVIPNHTEIDKILSAARKGQPYDVNAFDALITKEHVNDYWPSNLKTGTILHHIVRRQGSVDHLRPILEALAKKGADLNATDLSDFQNTPLVWAIANANYDMAALILELGSKYGSDFAEPKGVTSPIHLLLAKGYQSENNDGTQRFKNTTGSTLLRQLLIAAPGLVNMVDQQGFTPLHLAALRRDIEFCEILLAHGADPTILGPNQQTALDMLDKTAKEATEILERYTSKGALLDVEKLDSFKEEIGPSIANAIRDLFPPQTQIAIAFQLQAALNGTSSSLKTLKSLFGKLDKKYLNKKTLTELEDQPDLMNEIITKIVYDQGSTKKS